jgi:DNA transformation protein and related proteins
MPVTTSYRAFVSEQLGRVLPSVRARAMFGGVGLYSGTTFFGLIDDDVLYLKVNDRTRAAFEARGMRPFRPFGEEGDAMAYYELPADVLEDPEALAQWAGQSVEVGRRARQRRTRRIA